MHFDRDGAELQKAAVAQYVERLASIVAHEPISAGRRFADRTDLANWLKLSGVTAEAGRRLGGEAKAVRAILFDKTPDLNWSLSWHQDRMIAVRKRIEIPGFDHWTIKDGIQHVEPPFEILENMTTVRIHLDPVTAGNAPLNVMPGSHRVGKLSEEAIKKLAASSEPKVCLADVGDVWWYRTPIVHASARATGRTHRRVLQVDYSAESLPAPLEWRGIA